jgi:hypothetical protein
MNQLMIRLLLAAVEEFVSLAAVIGGVELVTGGLPVPIEWLVHASFTSYLIPGPLMTSGDRRKYAGGYRRHVHPWHWRCTGIVACRGDPGWLGRGPGSFTWAAVSG